LGYGRFVRGYRSDYNDYPSARPHPDAVRNPKGSNRDGTDWYIPDDTMRARAKYYNGPTYGASRSVAWDLARADIEDELSRLTSDYGPTVYVLIVTASREGIELGRDVLGGVEVAWDPITRTHGDAYIAETLREMAGQAIEDGRANLARLTAAGKEVA
jgi:hypothetical protein